MTTSTTTAYTITRLLKRQSSDPIGCLHDCFVDGLAGVTHRRSYYGPSVAPPDGFCAPDGEECDPYTRGRTVRVHILRSAGVEDCDREEVAS